MKIDNSKCSHGVLIEDNCEKCNEMMEKNKKEILKFIEQIETAHKKTSKSTLKFGNANNDSWEIFRDDSYYLNSAKENHVF